MTWGLATVHQSRLSLAPVVTFLRHVMSHPLSCCLLPDCLLLHPSSEFWWHFPPHSSPWPPQMQCQLHSTQLSHVRQERRSLIWMHMKSIRHTHRFIQQMKIDRPADSCWQWPRRVGYRSALYLQYISFTQTHLPLLFLEKHFAFTSVSGLKLAPLFAANMIHFGGCRSNF